MKLNIHENIRAMRKERKLTQEQLAEALGVTVGAVSKWESGANAPDLSVIAELADFFEVSVDALLGFELHVGAAKKLAERIFELGAEKHFEEAAAEAEKALVKYPNNFDVARACANMYCLMGIELSDDDAHRRQLALYERALELIDQNTDPRFSRESMLNRIAEAHVCLGEYEKGLELMKRNNAQGTNNGNIAMILAEELGRYSEGLEYMTDDLMRSVNSLINDATTGAMAYIGLGNPRRAEELLMWACRTAEGMLIPGKTCYIQRICARLGFTMAAAALADGRKDDAQAHLAHSLALLNEYSASPDNTMRGTWLENGEKYMSFDDLGDDCIAGAYAKLEKLQARLVRESHVLPKFDKSGISLTDLWYELTAE